MIKKNHTLLISSVILFLLFFMPAASPVLADEILESASEIMEERFDEALQYDIWQEIEETIPEEALLDETYEEELDDTPADSDEEALNLDDLMIIDEETENMPTALAGNLDTTPPVLMSFTPSQTELNAGEPFYATLDVVEDGTGIRVMNVGYKYIGEEKFTNFSHTEKAGGPRWDNPVFTGSYSLDCYSDQHTIPGVYVLNCVVLQDMRQAVFYYRYEDENGAYLSPDNGQTRLYEKNKGDFTLVIRNDAYTNLAPKISSCNLLTKDIITPDEGYEIQVEVDIESDSELSSSIIIGFDNGLNMIMYPDQNPAWTSGLNHFVFSLDEGYWADHSQSGEYHITSMRVSLGVPSGDDWAYYDRSYTTKAAEDGSLYLEDEEKNICALTGATSLRYTKIPREQTQAADVEAPKILSAAMDRNSVKMPGVFNVDLHITDDVSLGSAIVDIRGLYTGDWINFGRDPAVAEYEGRISVKITSNLIPGTYPVYLDVYDNASGHSSVILGDITIENEFDFAFEYHLSNPKLLEGVRNLQDGQTAKIMFPQNSSKCVASAALFQAIAGRDVKLYFYYEDLIWVVNGKDVTNPKDVNLAFQIYPLRYFDGDTEEDVLVIDFANSGTLPGKAQIRLKSDYISALHQFTGTLYVYFKDENTDEEELVEDSNSQVVIDGTDSWCYFDITHNSSYLLSGKMFKTSRYVYRTVDGVKYRLDKRLKTAIAYRVTDKQRKKIVVKDTVKRGKAAYKVTSISSSFMKGNKKVTSLEIGKNVRQIGKKAFSGCKNLMKINIRSKVIKTSVKAAGAFEKLHKNVKVSIPKKKKKAYMKWLKKSGLK